MEIILENFIDTTETRRTFRNTEDFLHEPLCALWLCVNFFISKQLFKKPFLFPIKKPAPSVLQKGAGLIFFKLLRANGHWLESYDAHPVKQFDKWIHRINFIPLDTEVRTTGMTVVIVVVAFTQH